MWLPDYLVDFPDQQDVLRYVLTATAPETKDNDFTWKDFQSRNNNELVAIFGNFVNRVLVLTHKYYDGIVPKCDIVTGEDVEVLNSVKSYFKNIEYSLDRFRFREASQQLMNIARIGNKYLAEQEPWKLIKSDSNRVRTIMNTALQIVTALAVISEPFLPFSANKLQLILNLKNKPSWTDLINLKEFLEDGHFINETSLLFSKIEDSKIEKQLLKLRNKTDDVSSNQELVLEKELITFEDFSKMDLRVGKILEASKIKKTNKLLLLKVDLGSNIRTVVSGIAKDYLPEDVIGVEVVLLCNLKPRLLRGVESQGMILMTKDQNGKMIFISPDSIKQAVPGLKIS